MVHIRALKKNFYIWENSKTINLMDLGLNHIEVAFPKVNTKMESRKEST
jgi:hypothetical protein